MPAAWKDVTPTMGDFMIVLDRNELMSSRMSGSEKALATMAIDRLAGRKASLTATSVKPKSAYTRRTSSLNTVTSR